MRLRSTALLCLSAALAIATAAGATTADDVCAPSADPCIVPQRTTIPVSDGSVLDFGSRALVLGGRGATLNAGGGSMAIVAGSVTLNPGSALLSSGGAIAVTASGAISVLRASDLQARIDVGAFIGPGAVTLDAGGDVLVQGLVTAQGAGAEGGDGSLAILAAGDVALPGEINVAGGTDSNGGEILIDAAGDVRLGGVVDLTGGIGGGGLLVVADGSITTAAFASGRIDARADGSEGDGGFVDLTSSGGDVAIGLPILATATSGIDFGGTGGDVMIEATAGSVVLGSQIDLSGAVPDGDGGDLDVIAGLDVTQTGAIATRGRDQTGVGGAVDFFARRAITAGSIDASGTCATCSGGDIALNAWCSVVVPTGAMLLAEQGFGQAIMLSGDDLAVHGTVRVGRAITLLHRDARNPPDLTGASLTPQPRIEADDRLIPCGGPSTCGNLQTEPGETCDDGNRDACDGCSPTCLVEACGNDELGCDALGRVEACDDGNADPCDGCAPDCLRRDDVCGDGIEECGEQCDTGPAVDCDPGVCSAQCLEEGCPNGRVECDEECDDGEATPICSDGCVQLTPPTCGDGVEDPGEGCDDENRDDCDGCSRFCQVEECGNGTRECAEGCDDFNTSPCDGCSTACQAEECGNEAVDCGEDCDEGERNGQPGSGCLECRDAPVCTPAVIDACIPCADPLECDPLGRCGGVDCLDGVCEPQPLDCTSDDPCEVGSCDAAAGCMFTPITGFAAVRCRMADIEETLGGDGVSPKARTRLGKLLGKSTAKVDAAQAALDAGKQKRVGKAIAASRKKLGRFLKKVTALQPRQITDPAVGAALTSKATNAIERLNVLEDEIGS